MAFVFKPVVIRTKNGRKVRRRTKYYWASYTDPVTGDKLREALKLSSGEPVTAKENAEQVLRELLNMQERIAAGRVDPLNKAAQVPIMQAGAGYIRSIRNKIVKRTKQRISRKQVYQAVLVIRWYVRCSGAKTLADLRGDRIGKALDTLLALGKTGRTANVYRAHLHGFCSHLSSNGLLEANPVRKVGTFDDDPVAQRRALMPDEARRLLAVAGDRALWYETALLTGLRVGELAALLWFDIDWDGPTPIIRLRAEATKGKRTDEIPLHPALAEKLLAVRPAFAKPIDRVFKSTPTRLTFFRDCVKAGIMAMDDSGKPIPDDRGCKLDRHALRTTFVSWLSASGAAPRDAQALARHRSIDMTMKVYTDPRVLW